MSDAFVQVAVDSTGKKIDTAELTVGANTVERQRFVLGDNTAPGNFAAIDPLNQLLVNTPATMVFTDSFDGGTVNVTDLWTTQVGGAGVVSQSNGKLSISSGVTALGYAAIFSKPTFSPKNISMDQLGFTVALESPTLANLTRFWGKGSVPATPTTAVPITDGFGFQLDGTATFRAVVYASGVMVSNTAVTPPGDAASHVYAVVYRGDTIILLKDNFTIPVAAFTTQPDVQALPIAIVAVAGASGPAGGQSMLASLVALGDSGKNANQIADGLFPWRTATVKPGSTAPAATDTALVTSVHPLSGIATASGTITTQNLVPAGTATAGSAVELTLNGANTLAVQVTGTYTGALSLQLSVNGAAWITVGGTPLINVNTGGYLASITSALQSIFQADVGGAVKARITGLAAMTGTATVTLRGVQSAALVALDTALPAGTNAIGVVDTELPVAAAIADALANPTTPQIAADGLLFNGATWDRARNNTNTTAGDTGAKTTTFNGATQTNFNAIGALITIIMGTVSGTSPTCAPQLQWSPDGGTTWITYGPAMANITASGNYVFLVYPANLSQTAGATPANLVTGAATTVAINAPLPRTWRLQYAIGGTTPSFTITSVQVNYLKN